MFSEYSIINTCVKCRGCDQVPQCPLRVPIEKRYSGILIPSSIINFPVSEQETRDDIENKENDILLHEINVLEYPEELINDMSL